jgi:competence protein ComEC
MRMVLFALCFTIGVWLLQQQAALPNFGWAWLLTGLPLTLLIPAKPLAMRLIRAMLFASFAYRLGFYHAAWQAEQRLAVMLPDEWQGRDIEIVGVVAELPRNHEHGQRFSFDVEKIITRVPGQKFSYHIPEYPSTFT